MGRRSDASRLLAQGALEELAPLVYDELRGLAAAYLREERRDHTLQPTALANEAYLRLVDESRRGFRDRAHFLALAARAMRQILVDHARRRKARKRGGDRGRVTLTGMDEAAGRPTLDLLDLHGALEALAEVDARKSRIVEMRFFGGLTTEEAAEALGVSLTTVEDDWYMARAWLRRRLAE